MKGDFANFRAVYDELTDEVMRAKHQFIVDHLANWFRTLDETSLTMLIIARLQDGLDLQAFLKESAATVGSFVGSVWVANS